MSSVLSDVNRGELAPSVRPQRRASLHRAPSALRAGLARRLAIVFAAAAMLFVTIPAAAAAEMNGDKSMDADMPAYAMRWWNVLSPEQMVAALHGDGASEAQMVAAKKMYADLDEQTRGLVNAAAKSIYQGGPFASVGSWWESLDCRLMRVAAGDGITADSSSKFCAHYPGSDHEKILMEDALMHVNKVGQALLGHDDAGTYPAAEVAYAMRWWNVLSPEQMVAALHGDGASEAQMVAAKKMYADLDEQTRGLVNAAAKSIYQGGPFASVGSWWESLDCRLMRVAAGDGITADSSSKFCAHYPGSDHEKILMEDALMHVNKVGQALLGRDDPGEYPGEMTGDDMDGDKSGDDMDGDKADDMMDGDKSGDDMDGDKADDMMDGDKSGDDMDDMMDGDKADDMKSDGIYHTVKPGEYLRKIAEMHLGHASHWMKIYEANKGKKQADGRTFTNPDLIIAGWVLHIPGA